MDALRLVPRAEPATSAPVTLPDVLREGPVSVRAQTAAPHPVQVIQDEWQAQQERVHWALQRVAFGSHLPVRMQMERHIVAQAARLPVLPTSRLGLDILEGKDELIEFEDYLNDPVHAVGKVDPHVAMEHKLRMN